MEQERARAAALGYEDPINPNFDATTDMYHKTLTECLRRVKKLKDAKQDPKKIAIMVASHNEDTVRFAIEKMKEIGISPEDKVICFGQLLGMCDYITMPLGELINKFSSNFEVSSSSARFFPNYTKVSSHFTLIFHVFSKFSCNSSYNFPIFPSNFPQKFLNFP